MFEFKHPKYYKELRKRNKSDQVISETKPTGDGERAPGQGLKVSSTKLQASSTKRQAFEPTWASIKRQASSPRQQASSVKPQAASSLILEPWYMDIGEVLGGKGPRAFTMINVLSGWRLWKAIWCGENLIFLLFVTLSSRVQKCPEVLQTNRSGVPSKLLFSIRMKENSLRFLLICW